MTLHGVDNISSVKSITEVDAIILGVGIEGVDFYGRAHLGKTSSDSGMS